MAHRYQAVELAATLRAVPALAHAGLPETGNVTVRRGHPEDLFVGATFGAVVSRDGGQSWRWLCPEAMGYGSSLPDAFLWREDGVLLAIALAAALVLLGAAALAAWEAVSAAGWVPGIL